MQEETIAGAGRARDNSEPLRYEAELVARARRAEPTAWTEIYERNYDRVFKYVYARVSDRETAEDLSSTVFLEALKSIRGYEHRGKPLVAWVYRIARNVVNYHYRQAMRRRAPEMSRRVMEPTESADQSAGREGDPAFLIEGWDVMQALTHLSSDQRDAIILRYFVGLTTPETATIMGKKERAVYSLHARAIKTLRRHLSEQELLMLPNSSGPLEQ